MKNKYNNIKVPVSGCKITVNTNNSLNVPNNPIIPFIEGDGIGIDITPVMIKVVNEAVTQAYNGHFKIEWMEIYAGDKALKLYGENKFLPKETLDSMREYVIAIKGPLTTPVYSGIRSLNVQIRQILDLYVCLRPIRWLPGVPSPIKNPENIDIVIFRENSEDIYTGIEWEANTQDSKKIIKFLQEEMNVTNIRFPSNCAIGIKPVSYNGTKRLIIKALQYAIDNDRKSVTIVHKGNIMKFTEGAFKDWSYKVAMNEFNATKIMNNTCLSFKNPNTGRNILINDRIADSMFQQILLRPSEYDIIATLNLNGDYLSDAIAAEVGGIGIAPGANLSDSIAVFEPIHGSAPKYSGQNKVNPSSIILSAEMMLRHIGWNKAADLIYTGLCGAIKNKKVTYDIARGMNPPTKILSCSDFGDAIIEHMY